MTNVRNIIEHDFIGIRQLMRRIIEIIISRLQILILAIQKRFSKKNKKKTQRKINANYIKGLFLRIKKIMNL